ncbi:hypothetical protein AB6N23_12205 [Cellulomonas sp. 179-A 9B4 NHS]|uniref:hypothetical protein n=1 Tax=Cellulomonas sp. 179-A 9B4 NHS TaxID=3142379 RepID=UPI0039A2E60F
MDATAWDTPAAYVMLGAAVLVVLGVLVMGVASTPAHRLLGLSTQGPWWFSPAGGRTQGLVVAYVAALVAVAALVFVLADAWTGATSLAWTLAWSSAAVVLWATAARVARLVVRVATGGRGTWDEPLEADRVRVDDAGDDVDLRAARDAATADDWLPAAHLLAATDDADARFDRVSELAALAVRRSRWLEAWRDAEPASPDAQALHVQALVELAWMRRGSDWEARDVEGFLEALQAADRAADEALSVSPRDASVLASRLRIARGLQLGEVEHARRLAQLRDVAPLHRGGLAEALQFAAPKWFGSTETMFTFARSVSAEAPAGHATGLLVVVAHVEHFLELGERSSGAAQAYMESDATRAEIRAAADRWSAGGPSPVGRAWGHNLLAGAFWMAELPAEAAPHLAETARHLTSFPWMYAGEPSEVHANVRAWARARVGDAAIAPA